MKHLILSTLVVLATLISSLNAQAADSKESKNVFSAKKSEFNERMYLYMYCLSTSPHKTDFTSASSSCDYILNKSNNADAKGLDSTITADLNGYDADFNDMLGCLSKEASRTSNMSDSSAMHFCQSMVNPTEGFGDIK